MAGTWVSLQTWINHFLIAGIKEVAGWDYVLYAKEQSGLRCWF
jgi:hypothetical protein